MTGPATAGRLARVAVAVVAATVLACAGTPSEPAAPTTTPPVAPDADEAGGAPPSTDPAAPGTSPAGDPGPGTAPPTAPGSPTTAGPADPAPVPTTVAPPGEVPVGQLAPFLLRPASGTRIVVEVRAQPGAEPSPSTLERVAVVLHQVSGKEVVLDGPATLGPGPSRWTPADLRRAADGAAASAQGDGAAVLRLLFVTGELADRPSVLGAAVRGDVAAVFGERVRSSAGLLVAPSVIEEAVTVHEVGHLLGLVDLFLPTRRADPDRPGHSPNRRSVMYWQVESDTITALLGGGIPRDFDADDLADLAAIRDG